MFHFLRHSRFASKHSSRELEILVDDVLELRCFDLFSQKHFAGLLAQLLCLKSDSPISACREGDQAGLHQALKVYCDIGSSRTIEIRRLTQLIKASADVGNG